MLHDRTNFCCSVAMFAHSSNLGTFLSEKEGKTMKSKLKLGQYDRTELKLSQLGEEPVVVKKD